MTNSTHLGTAERVELATLSQHPENPNNGDIDAIAESLRVTGQYRPIVVQRSTGHILAGNHTYAAALSLGWTHIDAWIVDVDNDTARRILVADNRIADLGPGMDYGLLVDVLQTISDTTGLEGTGYVDDDLTALVENLGNAGDLPTFPEHDPDEDPETTRTITCPACHHTFTP